MKQYISIFVLFLITGSVHTQNFRYVKPVFNSVEKTADVVYANASFLDFPYRNESSTTNRDLMMDIYQPSGDTLAKRPAIIFAHGGGFLVGKRDVDDMEAFCDSFARKGYVTATIDYRLGVEVADNGDMHYIRAAFRGVQDGRAAVRFLRANAEAYNIDPERIYWGGSSAGAFIGLASIYMDENEVPAYTRAQEYSTLLKDYYAPDLGGMDIGENLGYEGKPSAVMACWGGISDTLFINGDETTPVFLVHGTDDVVVPFNSGGPFSLNNVSDVFGSNAINLRLKGFGIPAEQIYFAEGEGHGFYGAINGRWKNLIRGNEHWDTVVKRATRFYFNQHRPVGNFKFRTQGHSIDCKDLSTGAVSWHWDFGDGNTSAFPNPQHTYTSTEIYMVKLYVENSIQSWDTISQKVIIRTTGHNEKPAGQEVVAYPNPTDGLLNVSIGNKANQVSISLCTINGETLITRTNLTEDKITMDLNEFEPGIYLLWIDSGFESSCMKVIRK